MQFTLGTIVIDFGAPHQHNTTQDDRLNLTFIQANATVSFAVTALTVTCQDNFVFLSTLVGWGKIIVRLSN